jgi:uncharacterized protein (TIGR00297 family)
MPFTLQLAIGSVVACALSAAAYRMRLLTLSGALASAAVGIAVFGVGGIGAAVPLLTFFATSNALGRWRRRSKERLGYEKSGARDALQVFANGGVASLAVLLGHFLPSQEVLWRYVFVAAVAEANADTWATEIGSATRARAVLITSLKSVEAGRSGGISLPGTLAAIAGALLVAIVAAPLAGPRVIAVAATSGFVGCLVDSLLGATLQARYTLPDGKIVEKRTADSTLAGGVSWINNDTVNTLGTVSAALGAWLLAR